MGLAPDDVVRHRAGREAAERADCGIPGLIGKTSDRPPPSFNPGSG